MSIEVIGSGFGRTGTKSLQIALERLGYAPCHHMTMLIQKEDEVPHWQAALRGQTPDWDRALASYRATVDWPSAFWWRDLIEHFPDARVIHTERDPQRWYDSIQKTIAELMTVREGLPPGPFHDMMEVADRIIIKETFGGRFHDRAHAIEAFERNNAEVRARVPAERLLIFQVSEGWEPLCAFLGKPVPDEPFPRVNTTAEFRVATGLDEAQ